MPRVSNKANKKNYVYGLDIGTRSVVGTVGYKDRERFVVVAQEIKEHESRAMLDGQIHDIESVSETIREVTLALIERIDTPLTQVCIAAAGRMLRTVTVHADLELDDERSVVEEDIHLLDSYGVEKAYETFLEEQSDADEVKYYCVGYSIMKYYLNDYPITNLENHKARKISCDMIATFLPDDVVDGLYKAVEMAGLEVANLTLEPIAAIELAIPEQFRMLNIALIDVGAGTSDISITKDGSIIAYGMLPVAGDCLTEDIARHCLVDFNTAESIKRAIEDHSEVEYKDIMGLTQKISRKDVLKACEEHLESMAAQVSDKIRELNGDKPVSAVFVVGGGGKIASYTDRVAKHLDIPKERCALRGEEVMGNIDFQQKNAEKSSLMVTPIGICLNYYEQSNNFIFVTFNEARVKVYDNNHLAVVDAALGAEFSNEDLFPKRGRSLEFILNGEKKVILGKRGESSVITVNGKPADITTPIHKNDVISVIPGTAGEEGSQIVGRLPELRGDIHVKYEDQILTLPKLAMANGELVTSGYEIKQQDRIDILNYYTVSQILEFMDIPKEYVSYIAVNHENSDMDGKVYDNFTLSFTLGDTTQINADSQKSFEELFPEDYADVKREAAVTSNAQTLSDADINSISEEVSDANDQKPEAEPEDKPAPSSPVFSSKATYGGFGGKESLGLGAVPTSFDELMGVPKPEPSPAPVTSSSFSMPQTSVTPSVSAASHAAFGTDEATISSLEAKLAAARVEFEEKFHQPAPKPPIISSVPIPDLSAKPNPITSLTSDVSAVAKTDSIASLKPEASASLIHEPKSDPVKETVSEPASSLPPDAIQVMVNGETIVLSGKKEYVYVDAFTVYEFDLSNPKGKSVETLLNGQKAEYTAPLKNGDDIRIFWKD